MHSAATLLLPVAEKSKVPFYVAGGLLASWAVIVSLLIGLRRADFPASVGGQRIVIAISAVLVLGAVSMAVVTSSAPAKAGTAPAASGGPGGTPGPPPGGAPAPAGAPPPPAPVASAPARATTGTPAPPSSPARSAPATIALSADSNGLLSFDKKQISARAGSISITLANASTLEHNVTIAQGSSVLGATPTFARGSKTVTVTLSPGTYTFYCSVPGHRQGGMEGTLSIT